MCTLTVNGLRYSKWFGVGLKEDKDGGGRYIFELQGCSYKVREALSSEGLRVCARTMNFC